MSTMLLSPSISGELLDVLVAETRRYRRAFFRHHGLGPWPCFFCEEDVEIDVLDVHHVNGDHDDESSENLAASHKPCHARGHGKGRDMTAIRTIRWAQPGAGQQYAATMRERGHKIPCPDCGRQIVHWHMERHRGSAQCNAALATQLA